MQDDNWYGEYQTTPDTPAEEEVFTEVEHDVPELIPVAQEPTPDEWETHVNNLMEENERLKEQLAAQVPLPPPVDEDAELYYMGVMNPEYRLVTIYVPFNVPNVSKMTGFDLESGESYPYTLVKAAHILPGTETHRFDEFKIRLDTRVVAPAFVAEILGDRCDLQEYYPEN